jgi:hypothetical protein
MNSLKTGFNLIDSQANGRVARRPGSILGWTTLGAVGS